MKRLVLAAAGLSLTVLGANTVPGAIEDYRENNAHLSYTYTIPLERGCIVRHIHLPTSIEPSTENANRYLAQEPSALKQETIDPRC